MKREYTQEWKVLDMKYQKDDGLVVEVEYQLTVSAEGITKSKKFVKKFRKSRNFIILEDLTEEIVIGWVTDERIFDRNPPYVRRLQLEIEKEINSPIASGLPWN